MIKLLHALKNNYEYLVNPLKKLTKKDKKKVKSHSIIPKQMFFFNQVTKVKLISFTKQR